MTNVWQAKCPKCNQFYPAPPKNWDCPTCPGKLWEPDENATQCYVCNKSFGKVTATRHHCRFCGRVVCKECSKNERPYWGIDKQRCCDVCVGLRETVPESTSDNYAEQTNLILSELKRLYETTIKPLEQKTQYDGFRPSWFSDELVQTKPLVTFLGPFSAGKSSFINFLLQGNYLLTGPQPVTDRFTVIMHGEEVSDISGRLLASACDHPYRGLNYFGESFLESFAGKHVPHEVLKSVTLVDTPGVLESAGGVFQRKYDYVKACRWFVERSDLVFVLFDPTKLDAGQELRMMFKHALKGSQSKVRIILNKADSVDSQELMKVYGSLFWNLSELLSTTEPPRVYVSSFWDKAYEPNTNHFLFTEEKADLIFDLTETIPLQCIDKKVAASVRRCQDVMIHAYIVGTLRTGLPTMFGKDKAKAKALDALEATFESLSSRYHLVLSDFPTVDEYRGFFEKFDLYEMPNLDQLMLAISEVRKLAEVLLPKMLKPIKQGFANPQDRKSAVRLQKAYFHQMASQLQGQQGLQGVRRGPEMMALPPNITRQEVEQLIQIYQQQKALKQAAEI